MGTPIVQVRLSTRHALTYAPLALRDTGKHKKLTPGAWDFLEPLEDIDATHAVLAEVDGKLVGWFRCTLQQGVLYAQGTWVEPTYRKLGIAKKLWHKALTSLNPKSVSYDLASSEGGALVGSIKREYSDIDWCNGS